MELMNLTLETMNVIVWMGMDLMNQILNGPNKVESGDKVILPQSALHSLATMHMEYPMLFELWNPSTEHVAYCGLIEFTAEEGELYMPN
ncbi:hypothetical protein AMTRI_Chr06g198540 [Amborella trichopoda]